MDVLRQSVALREAPFGEVAVLDDVIMPLDAMLGALAYSGLLMDVGKGDRFSLGRSFQPNPQRGKASSDTRATGQCSNASSSNRRLEAPGFWIAFVRFVR